MLLKRVIPTLMMQPDIRQTGRLLSAYSRYIIVWCLGMAALICVYNYDRQRIKESEKEHPHQIIMHPTANSRTSGMKCRVGEPCVRSDQVDLRVIVLTYDRPRSLAKCLEHLALLDMMGDSLVVEIWVDMSKDGKRDNATVTVAEAARRKWTQHQVDVRLREKHAGIAEQWTNTWRPAEDSREIALIVEDDVDVSPMAYRWLKAVHANYNDREDIQGYTLQMQSTQFFAGKKNRPLTAPKQHQAFLYGVLGTWGFSPHPKTWTQYQDWMGRVRRKGLKPYVEGIQPTQWYKSFEAKGTQDGMWEMWQIYFSHINNLYCVYCNLKAYTQREDVLLSWNRKENGLHFHGSKKTQEATGRLLSEWNDSYVQFPATTIRFNYAGTKQTLA